MKEETLALFPGEDMRGSRRHREIKQSGAYEMAMKGRGDSSLGRCEERGERWTVRQEAGEA